MTTYQVTSAAAIVRDRGGSQHMFYEKAVFDDGNFDGEHVKMLAKEGFIEKVKAPKTEEPTGPNPGTAEFILKEVGDDKAKAKSALDEENSRETPRKTVVDALEKTIAG